MRRLKPSSSIWLPNFDVLLPVVEKRALSTVYQTILCLVYMLLTRKQAHQDSARPTLIGWTNTEPSGGWCSAWSVWDIGWCYSQVWRELVLRRLFSGEAQKFQGPRKGSRALHCPGCLLSGWCNAHSVVSQ